MIHYCQISNLHIHDVLSLVQLFDHLKIKVYVNFTEINYTYIDILKILNCKSMMDIIHDGKLNLMQ